MEPQPVVPVGNRTCTVMLIQIHQSPHLPICVLVRLSKCSSVKFYARLRKRNKLTLLRFKLTQSNPDERTANKKAISKISMLYVIDLIFKTQAYYQLLFPRLLPWLITSQFPQTSIRMSTRINPSSPSPNVVPSSIFPFFSMSYLSVSFWGNQTGWKLYSPMESLVRIQSQFLKWSTMNLGLVIAHRRYPSQHRHQYPPTCGHLWLYRRHRLYTLGLKRLNATWIWHVQGVRFSLTMLCTG